MKVCAFFGPSKVSCRILPYLIQVIREMIDQKGVRVFLFQIQGEFEIAVQFVLQLLKHQHPELQYFAVSNRPLSKEVAGEVASICIASNQDQPDHVMHWMLRQSDYVISYVPEGALEGERRKAHAVMLGGTVIELRERMEEAENTDASWR